MPLHTPQSIQRHYLIERDVMMRFGSSAVEAIPKRIVLTKEWEDDARRGNRLAWAKHWQEEGELLERALRDHLESIEGQPYPIAQLSAALVGLVYDCDPMDAFRAGKMGDSIFHAGGIQKSRELYPEDVQLQKLLDRLEAVLGGAPKNEAEPALTARSVRQQKKRERQSAREEAMRDPVVSVRLKAELKAKIESAKSLVARYESSINVSRKNLEAFPMGSGCGNARTRRRQGREINRDLNVIRKLDYWRSRVARLQNQLEAFEAGTHHLNGQPRKRPKTRTTSKLTDERLFIGVFPCGIHYADRWGEEHGEYKRLGFLPYDTLELKLEHDCPTDLANQIRANAANLQARRGQDFQRTCSGQSIRLGSALAV